MASAAFHFDAQASLLKKSATAGGTVTLTLDSTDGVRTVLWEVSTTDDNASTWTITGATSDGATLTVPSGVRGEACIIRCTVNGGTPTGTEDALDLVKTAKVYVWPEVMCAAEETESNQTYGWSGVVNQFVRGSQQKIHTADGTLIVNGLNILTSVADGMTIPLAASYPGQGIIVLNDMAATNATLTTSGSDTIAGGTTGSTYVLAFGAPGLVTLIASADTTANKWYAAPRL